MSPEFEAAYLRHAALSFDKQLNLAKVIGTRNWNFSMDSGHLTFAKQGFFDKNFVFEAQILGSAAKGTSSWRWAWANDGVPDKLNRASLLLREKGGIPEFSEPEFPIDFSEADDHRIALTGSGVLASLFGCDAYYRGPYEGGAAFFLLRDPRLHLAPPDAIHISTFFPQLISSMALSNHRTVFLSYLEQQGLEAQIENEAVRVEIGASSLVANFDDLNRLADMQLTARPEKA